MISMNYKYPHIFPEFYILKQFYVGLQVLRAQAPRPLPRLHEELLLLGAVRLASPRMDAVGPRPPQKPYDILAAKSRHATHLVEHPAAATSVKLSEIVLLLSQDVLLDGSSAHGFHAPMVWVSGS